MQTIAILMPNGWGIRTYLLTDFLSTLAGRARVIALTPAADHPAFREAMRDKPVILEKLQLRPLNRWTRHLEDFFVYSQYYRQPNTLTRLYFHHLSIRMRWPTRAILQSKRFLAGSIGRPISIGMQTGIEKLAYGMSQESARVRNIFRQHKVDLVFSTMPLISYFERPALWAAQACGIPMACMISSWDNLASKGRLPIRFDTYLTWSNLMKAELLRKYPFIRDGQVAVTGPPHFDFYRRPDLLMSREDFMKTIGGDPARPLILWSAASTNQYPNEPDILEAFYHEFSRREGARGPQILVRAHPIGGLQRFGALKERCPGLLFSETNPDDPKLLWTWTPSLDDIALLVNSLHHADVTVNNGSTMTLDACAMNRPVINLAYDSEPGSRTDWYVRDSYRYDHYQSVLKAGAVRMAYSLEELITHIHTYLKDPHLEKEGRRALLDLQCGDVDGRAARRAAEAVLRAVSEGASGSPSKYHRRRHAR